MFRRCCHSCWTAAKAPRTLNAASCLGILKSCDYQYFGCIFPSLIHFSPTISMIIRWVFVSYGTLHHRWHSHCTSSIAKVSCLPVDCNLALPCAAEVSNYKKFDWSPAKHRSSNLYQAANCCKFWRNPEWERVSLSPITAVCPGWGKFWRNMHSAGSVTKVAYFGPTRTERCLAMSLKDPQGRNWIFSTATPTESISTNSV